VFPNATPGNLRAGMHSFFSSGLYSGDHGFIALAPAVDADAAHRRLRGLVREVCAATAEEFRYVVNALFQNYPVCETYR